MIKKILITGGAGFIGLNLANYLSKKGYQVHIIDNFSRAVDDADFQETLKRDNINFSSLNLLDSEDIEDLNNDYDVIFHLAAIIGVTHVLNKPYSVLYDNIQMLANMINFAKKQTNLSRFFFASTSEVYAGTLKYFDLPIPTPESAPLAISDLSHPRTSYMLSKIYGEAMCQQSGLPFTIFRPHNVYGPRMGMSHVIPEQLQKAYNAKNGDSVIVFSVDHTRCFCYIDDAIEMLWRMIENTSCLGKTLNLGTQNPEVSIKEVSEICFLISGKSLKIDSMPPSPGSPTRRAPDMEYTNNLINFESQVELYDGIQNTYKWYKKNVFEGFKVSAK
jgi:UDP-glucose 4-epimerase